MITILLIRGLSRQQGHWGEFPNYLKLALKEKGAEVNLIFEDLPGFGNRNQQKSPSTIEKIAELLVPTLENLYTGTKRKVHIVGISMGGMVALELARRFPIYCQSLVMINSSVKPVSCFFHRLQPKAYPALVKAWFHPLRRESEREILKISSELYGKDEELLNHWLSLRKKQAPSRKAAFLQIIAASQYQAPLNKPIEHVCLIASKKDRVVSHQCTLNLAKYWDIQCYLHLDGGHDLSLDDPSWLSETLSNWYLDH
jgi:pimeloyl-ACP methyl ester carboxylesterase